MSSLQITFLDVQHGLAVHIETPTGKHIMFDIGTGDHDGSQGGGENYSPLRYLSEKKGVSEVDCVIISHPHEDHISDIENFKLVKPRSLLRIKHLDENFIRGANTKWDQSKLSKYFAICEEYHNPVESAMSALNPTNNGCDVFQVFNPKPDSKELNDHSLALVIAHANTKFLIMGDTEKKGWEALLADPSFLEIAKGTNIFLSPHHGRENGFHEDFYSKVGTPDITIISDIEGSTTSAREKYTNRSSGLQVLSRTNNTSSPRKTLSTHNDGTIQILCWRENNGQTWRRITANR